MKKYLCLFLVIVSISAKTHAAMLFQYSMFYNTYSDDVENFSYSRMNNGLFVGASLGRGVRFFLGPSYHLWSKSHQADAGSTASEASFSEFGATLITYLDQAGNWKFELTYNPMVKGERTTTGTPIKLDGSGYRASIGYQLKLSGKLYLGASLNYHSVGISSEIESNTETEATTSYSNITPTLELAFRY